MIASIHAEAIAALPAARLAAVTDVEPERAQSLAGEFGCAAEPDLAALLARDDVDVVSVCVPSGLHADVGVRAALEVVCAVYESAREGRTVMIPAAAAGDPGAAVPG